jgi:hypothetical protein
MKNCKRMPAMAIGGAYGVPQNPGSGAKPDPQNSVRFPHGREKFSLNGGNSPEAIDLPLEFAGYGSDSSVIKQLLQARDPGPGLFSP